MTAPGMPSLISVANPPEISLSPGELVAVPVTIRMAGVLGAVAAGPMAQVSDLVVEVLGLDSAGSVTIPAGAPGQEVTVTVPVTLPTGTPAGRVDLRVSVQPVDAAGRAVGSPHLSDLMLVVGTTASLLMDIAPSVPRGNGHRRFRLVLDNRSPAPIDVALTVDTAAGLRATLASDRTVVPARTVVEVKGRLRARGRALGPIRRMPFVVSAQGATTPARVNAVFEQRPALHGGPSKAIALVLVVAIWVGIAFAGLQAVAKHQRNSQTSVTKTAQQSAAKAAASNRAQAAAAADPAGGAGNQAAASSAADAKAAALIAAAGVRLNGTVAGASPGGVTVSVQPTSLVDEAALGARDVTNGMTNAAFVTPLSGEKATSRDLPGKTPESEIPYTAPAVQSPVSSTVTQSDGSWFIAGIKAPGYYLVTFTKTGYQPQKYVVTTTPGATIPPLMVTMTPGAGALNGVVTDAQGHPLGGATISITDGTHTVTTNTPTRGDIGHWQVSGLATPAHYLVSASRSGYGAQATSVDLTSPGSGQTVSTQTVNLTLQTGTTTVSGVITAPDADGNVVPLGGATVTLTEGTFSRSATTSTATGQVGEYVISDVPIPGVYTITVTGAGVVPRSQTVSLRPGSGATQVSPAPLSLATGTVTGRVTDSATGQPLDETGITLTGDGGTYKVLDGTVGSNTAAQYRITGVPPGSYVLTAVRFGYQDESLTVTLTGGTAIVKDLALAPVPDGGLPESATITGSALDARTGARIAGCDPDIAPAAACLLTAGTTEVRNGKVVPFTDAVPAAESYTLPDPAKADPNHPQSSGLLPGLHAVTLAAPGYEPGGTNVLVPLGQHVQAPTVSLSPTAIISGTVSKVSGVLDPLPAGICVTAEPVSAKNAGATCSVNGSTCTTGAGAFCAVVTTAGTYSVKNLIHGSYQVRVITPAGSPFLPVPAVSLTLAVSDTKTYDVLVHRQAYVEADLEVPSPAGVLGPPGPTTVTLADANTKATVATATSDASTGAAVFNSVAPGSYTVSATSSTGASASIPLTVSLDQTVRQSLVLTSAVAANAAGVVATGTVTKVIDTLLPVGCATVRVSGIIGYNGSTPITSVVYVRTVPTGGAAGQFVLYNDSQTAAQHSPAETTCPANTPPAGSDEPAGVTATAAYLPLVVPQVQVRVDGVAGKDGYATLDVAAATVNNNALGLQVTPNPIDVTDAGTLTLSPNPSSVTDARVQVVSAAPGAGTVAITLTSLVPGSTDSYYLDWQDSTLGDGLAVPGTYVLRASYPGYDDMQATVVIGDNTGATAPAVPFALHVTEATEIDVQALCAAVTQAPCTSTSAPLLGVTATIKIANTTTVATLTAPAGATTASSPKLPVDDVNGKPIVYTVDIRVAGFVFATDQPVGTITAGTTQTVKVRLTQDGSISGVLLGQNGAGLPSAALQGVTVTATAAPSVSSAAACSTSAVSAATGSSFSAATAGDGSFTVTGSTTSQGLDDGCYVISVGDGTSAGTVGSQAPAGYKTLTATGVYRQYISGHKQVTLSQADTTFVANPVDLTVTVNFSDAPTTDPGVTLTFNPSVTVPTPVFTAAAGAVPAHDDFVFSGANALVPQVYGVTASATHYGLVTTSVSLTAGSSNNRAAVTLGSNVNTLAGAVTLSPVAGVTVATGQSVTVIATSTSAAPPAGTCPATTPSGSTVFTATVTALTATQYSYTISNLPDGNYTVTAESRGSCTSGATQVDFLDSTIAALPVNGGNSVNANFTLTEATRSLPVTLTSTASNDGLAGSTVTLTPANGSPTSNVTTTAADGTVGTTFNQLPAGSYGLTVTGANGHQNISTAVTVPVPVNTSGTADGAMGVTALQISEDQVTTTVTVNYAANTSPPPVTVAIFDGDPTGTGTQQATATALSAKATSSSATATVLDYVPHATATYYARATSPGFSTADGTIVRSTTNIYLATASLTINQATGLTVTVQRGSDPTGISGDAVDVYLSTDTTFANPKGTGTTGANGSYTFSSLAPGTYRVQVTDSGTTTTAPGTTTLASGSAVIVSVVLPAGKPGKPTITSPAAATVTTTPTVKWTAATDAAGGTITGYQAGVYAADASGKATGPALAGGPATIAAAQTYSYSPTGLPAGNYVFQVTTVAGSQTSDPATSPVVTVPATPGAPTISTVTVTGSPASPQVQVSWTAASGSTPDSYTVSDNGTASTPQTGTEETFTYPTSEIGKAHSYTVVATYYGLISAASAAKSATIAYVPDKVATPTLAADATPVTGQLQLTWAAPAAEGSNITGYAITITDETTASGSKTATSAGTSYAATGLTAGDTYHATVAAVNGVGTGAASSQSGSVKAPA